MTDTPDLDRLHRLLGADDVGWLVDRVRRRMEQGRPLTGTVTLGAASAAQRRAVELLLGRRAGKGASLSVSLEEVDRVLRTSGVAPGGLGEAVVSLRGPVRDLAAESLAAETAWRDALAPFDDLVAARPELRGWRSWLQATGLIRRLAPAPDEARTMLGALTRIVARLPAPGLPIGRLAAETCGDAHALDEGRPLATLALSAARALAGLPYPIDGGADSRRATWAAVGVHLDELSSVVLCVGLPGDDHSATGRVLAAAAGEPCVLTLRQLRRHDTPLLPHVREGAGRPGDGTIRVCENPVVVAAAADELGPSCPPLVCVGGRPSAAVWRLLELLAAGGARFAYHGDYDWGGMAIASALHERIGFVPWRFDAAHYETAASAAPPSPTTAPLTGRPRPTPWDPPLREAMARHALRIEEELVLPTLLADLRSAAEG
jgi:uncharacterized protein (TIGR02679 family)